MLSIHHINKYIHFVLLLLLTAITATAQQASINFHHLNTANGLSDPVVRCMTADKYGYIWLGTVNGLNRFNGYDVKIFQHQPDDSLSLPYNSVQFLFCDTEGELWVEFSKGIYKYDYSNSHFIFQPGSADLGAGEMIQGEKGQIYIATIKGLVLFDTKALKFTTLSDNTRDEDKMLMKKTAYDFNVHSNGNIYIATDTGLVAYNIKDRTAQRIVLQPVKNKGIERVVADKKGNLFISYTDNGSMLLKTDLNFSTIKVYSQFLSPRNRLQDNIISGAFTDNKGRVWITTNHQGLCLYVDSTDSFVQYEPDPIQVTSIASDYITFFYQDRDGYIWVSTEGYGADYFHPDKNLFHSIQRSFTQKPTLPDNWSRVAGEDKNNNLWLGTSGGLAKYDVAHNKMTLFQNIVGTANVLYGNSIRSILCDDDLVWIGTSKGLNRYHLSTGKMDFMGAKDSLPLSFYWSIIKDYAGNTWFGCREGLYRYNFKTKKIETLNNDPVFGKYSKKNVRILFQDSHHRLWVGFYSDGLLMYDPATNEERYFGKNETMTTEVKDGNILSITEDKSGLIWFSNISEFNSYDTHTGVFKHYTNSEAGMSEVAASMMCDEKNRLWIASSRGLYLFDADRRFFRSFGIEDGLPSVDFNNQAAYRTHNGNFIYATLKGFVLYNPANFVERNDTVTAYLSSFKIFGKNFTPSSALEDVKDLSLGYDQNFFSLELTALNYTNARQNWYAYKLVPFDKDWIYTKERQANYTNVPGGDYTFYYKTSTDHEAWNVPEKNIRIHVGTVFYKTWWFRLFGLLLVIAIVYWVYRYRISQKEKMLMLEKKAYSLEKEKALVMYESLKQQLNPHFLFNSLTSLSSLITSNPLNAKLFLDRLSKIYRYILQSRDNETVPLADEIKLAEIYTQLQQTRFKEGLQLKMEIPEEHMHRKIAPVTLQNLIENAIKHNVIDTTTPLLIHIFVEGDWLVVQNNSQKKNFVDTSNRQGLANMQSLYHYLSGKQMIITEDEHHYTTKIPLL